MIVQKTIQLEKFGRGFHLIGRQILDKLGELPEQGLLHLFLQHTSAGLCVNENADPDVRHDFELYFNRIVEDNIPGMKHTIEGVDDMPAHIKSSLTGAEVTIPIRDHSLALGTWQGIYLCEYRNKPRRRTVLATIMS